MLFLSSDKFMPEMHVRQARFTYSVCEPFTKKTSANTKELKKLVIQGIYIRIN